MYIDPETNFIHGEPYEMMAYAKLIKKNKEPQASSSPIDLSKLPRVKEETVSGGSPLPESIRLHSGVIIAPLPKAPGWVMSQANRCETWLDNNTEHELSFNALLRQVAIKPGSSAYHDLLPHLQARAKVRYRRKGSLNLFSSFAYVQKVSDPQKKLGGAE